MTIKEIKKWSPEQIIEMCIENEYYTCGNNESYNKMLEFVSTNKPTKSNIYKVAKNIVKHSDLTTYGQTEIENIQSIMFAITKECVNTFYKIEE